MKKLLSFMSKILSFLNKYKYIIAPGILGAIAFIAIYGTKVLNPTNTNWILNSRGDLAQHYLGWEFYRNSPWTFPIGMITIAPYPYSISVIFTDSIPWLAFVCKIFSFILPTHFQYLGLYGIFCFILQGITSSIVLKKFIKNDYLIIILSSFFILSLTVIYRMFYHTSLSSQYLIFLAFILVLYKDKFSFKKTVLFWGLLGILCASTHMYFALMDGIILIGYMLYELLSTKKIKQVIATFLSYLESFFFTVFLLGGFSLPLNPIGRSSIGTFSFNLNGFFNPFNRFSKFIKELPTPSDLCQEEGFAYLGLGLIIILILAILSYIYKLIRRKKLNFDKKLLFSIIVVSFISIFFASSDKIYFGNKLIFKYEIPQNIHNIIGFFRSNGRIIWIFYYILILLCFYILDRIINKKILFILAIVLLGVQIYDISDLLKDKKNAYAGYLNSEYNSNYNNPYFNRLFQEDFDNVILSSNNDIDYLNLLALKYNKKINIISLAQDILFDKVMESIREFSKKEQENSIYIIDQLDYLIFKDLNLNFYKLEGLYIATNLELDYLEPHAKTNTVEKKVNSYNCFLLDDEKKYSIKVTTENDELDKEKIEVYGIEFDMDNGALTASIEHNNRVCMNIRDIEVNLSITELQE